MLRALLIGLFGISLCNSALAEDDIRGKHLKLVYSGSVGYTINILKDGRILAYNPGGGPCPGASGDEAVLGRTHSYVIRCKSERTNKARSTASYKDRVLRLKIDITFGGAATFSYDWTIKVSGDGCSGQLRGKGPGGSVTHQITSCRVAPGRA